MSVRAKIILITLLLVLSLSCIIYTAHRSVAAFQNFRQQETLYSAGDVRTISSWMTIHYIAHTYHVPESYLYQTLHITDNREKHVTLNTLATLTGRPINDLIHTLQKAITTYHKQHPPQTRPRPSPTPVRKTLTVETPMGRRIV